MRILIADDHAVVRRGLKEILAEALPGAEFSEAGNGDEVMSHLGKTLISLLVLPAGGTVCRALPARRRGRVYQ